MSLEINPMIRPSSHSHRIDSDWLVPRCIPRVLYLVALWLQGFFLLILMHFDWSLGHSFLAIMRYFCCGRGSPTEYTKKGKTGRKYIHVVASSS